MAPSRYQGIIPPLVTPLSEQDALDHAGFERLIEHVIEGGVHGIFILGTTGEAPSLSYRLRREVISFATKQVAGRVPVFVGVTDTAFTETISLARHAANEGADVAVLTTPYYFPAGQTELLHYLNHVVEQLPLPLMLYNMPSLTKVALEIETLEKLSHHSKILGVKDSGGDLPYFERLVGLKKLRPDWSMLLGPEAMLPQAMALGGDGGVHGGANVFPKLFVACFDACVRKDQAEIERVSGIIHQWQSVYDIGKYASRYIKATKCSLSILGICDDFMAEPFQRFKEAHRAQVEQMIERLKERLRTRGI